MENIAKNIILVKNVMAFPFIMDCGFTSGQKLLVYILFPLAMSFPRNNAAPSTRRIVKILSRPVCYPVESSSYTARPQRSKHSKNQGDF